MRHEQDAAMPRENGDRLLEHLLATVIQGTRGLTKQDDWWPSSSSSPGMETSPITVMSLIAWIIACRNVAVYAGHAASFGVVPNDSNIDT